MRVAGAAGQFVAPQLDAREAAVLDSSRYVAEIEAVVIERGAMDQFGAGQVHQHALEAVARVAAVVGPHAQLLLHLLIEVLKQYLARLDHRLVDFAGEVELELLEAGLDFLGLSAVLVDLGDTPLEIDTGADGTQHFVASPKHALEELELLRQQLVHPCIGLIAAVDEVDHHHVVLLTVAVAAPDALLDALRVPRQVVVDDERAELEVDAFGSGLGGNHDLATLLEVLDQCRTGVGGLGAGDAVGAFVALQPVLVDRLRTLVAIGAVEEHDAVAVWRVSQQVEEVFLRALGFGEYDGLPGHTQPIQFGEGAIQRGEQRLALGVVADVGCQRSEVAQLLDLLRDGIAFQAARCCDV